MADDKTTPVDQEKSEKRIVEIPAVITVGELAEKLEVGISQLISELMRNGVMATVNEKIDFDIVQIIAEEVDSEIELVKIEQQERTDSVGTKISSGRAESAKATERPPIVAVMGHVDHGKTSLLDAIRKTDVAEGEAGGITQHISAYQIEHKDRKVTFLDTPGHEAFAAIREHGAQLTDVALIVVAADDGIKPQTEEAIKFATKAGVQIVVAINKVDKADADLNRIKQQLSDAGLQPEEWGGSTVVVEVSAKDNTNIDKLIDMVFLVADLQELKAEKGGMSEGLVIEAHLEQGRGATATLLIEHGELKKGDLLVSGDTYAKVRTMQDDLAKDIAEAGPSTPVQITGFKDVPRFGDRFVQVKTEKEAKKVASDNARASRFDSHSVSSGADMLQFINKKTDITSFPVIIKTDVQGSLKSVIDALNNLKSDDVAARVVLSDVGAISENDIMTAKASDAVIYGFGVELSSSMEKLAKREGVIVETYKIIYELIDSAKAKMSDLLEDEIVEEEVGVLDIQGVFRITQKALICGGKVKSGSAKPDIFAQIIRDETVLGDVTVVSVQKEKSEVKELKNGEIGGLELKTTQKVNAKVGDTVRFFTREVVERSL